MTDREYFGRLEKLCSEGAQKAAEGRRTMSVYVRIAKLTAYNYPPKLRRIKDLLARIAQALAIAGYLTAVALAMLALSMSVECVVSGLPARLWMVYAGGALAALLLGVVAHALYDGSN